MDRDKGYRVDSSRILSDQFAGEVIAINNVNGNYYSLRGTASEIWALLETGASLNQVSGLFSARFAEDPDLVASSVEAFWLQLIDEELLVEAGELPPRDSPGLDASSPRDEFVPPKLEIYSDMQDLLLLDPIHEVDASGWPNKPDESSQS